MVCCCRAAQSKATMAKLMGPVNTGFQQKAPYQRVNLRPGAPTWDRPAGGAPADLRAAERALISKGICPYHCLRGSCKKGAACNLKHNLPG